MILKRRIFIDKEWKHRQNFGKKRRRKRNKFKERENLDKDVMLLFQGYWDWINLRKYWWDSFRAWKIIVRLNKLWQKRIKISIKRESRTYHLTLKKSIAISITKSRPIITKEHKWMILWLFQNRYRTSKDKWKKTANFLTTKRQARQFNQSKRINGSISVKFVKRVSYYQPYWNSK